MPSAIVPTLSCWTSSRRCWPAPAHARIFASSTRRSWIPRTFHASPVSGWCRACSRRTAPRTCAGPESAAAPSASRVLTPGGRCSTRERTSRAAPNFPVEDANPFHGLHAALTRRPRDGEDPHWQPGQRMTRDEAMRSFTTWNARSVGLEADQGSLEVGRRADLIALDLDPFTCEETAIARLTPSLTMVGGEIVSGERPPA